MNNIKDIYDSYYEIGYQEGYYMGQIFAIKQYILNLKKESNNIKCS